VDHGPDSLIERVGGFNELLWGLRLRMNKDAEGTLGCLLAAAA